MEVCLANGLLTRIQRPSKVIEAEGSGELQRLDLLSEFLEALFHQP